MQQLNYRLFRTLDTMCNETGRRLNMKWCTDFTQFKCNLEKDCEKRKKEGCVSCEEGNDCLFCANNGICKEAIITPSEEL